MTFSFIAVGSPFPMVKESCTAKPSHTTAGYRIAESYVQSSLLVVRRGDRRGACEPEGHTQCWYRIWYIEASCQPRARSLLRCRRNFSKRHNGRIFLQGDHIFCCWSTVNQFDDRGPAASSCAAW